MEFHVVKHDGPARIGELRINSSVVKTPNIFYPYTDHYKPPVFADIVVSDKKKMRLSKPCLCVNDFLLSSNVSSNPDLIPRYIPSRATLVHINSSTLSSCEYDEETWVIIPSNIDALSTISIPSSTRGVIVSDAYQLMLNPRLFVGFIVNLRRHVGYQRLIHLPGVADPNNLSLLCYLGVDLFDSLPGVIAARQGFLLTSDGCCNIYDLDELPCCCPACSRVNDPSDMGFKDILDHNYYAYYNELKIVRNAITRETIRDLVERRVRVRSEYTGMLRILDTDHYDFLEERTPVTRRNVLVSTSKESLNRPEIRRFQDRLDQRYRKPRSTKILILLPCSAKKPYSFSKTHQLFKKYIADSGASSVIHEVIVTSPLGLVPRELEVIYPASRYDTPVTGVWDEDEKKMIRILLRRYLRSNKYDHVIVHLPANMQEFIVDLIDDPIITCVDTPVSEDSLKLLNKEVKGITNDYELVHYKLRILEDIESLACFQFGRVAGENIIKDCEVKGRYPGYKLFSYQKQIAMMTRNRGYLSLTMHGAERLYQSGAYWVLIDDDFLLKGSLLSPGVKDADPMIRIGDEVVVVRNDKPYAVGVAQMNGSEMKESNKGEAVRIRHIAG